MPGIYASEALGPATRLARNLRKAIEKTWKQFCDHPTIGPVIKESGESNILVVLTSLDLGVWISIPLKPLELVERMTCDQVLAEMITERRLHPDNVKSLVVTNGWHNRYGVAIRGRTAHLFAAGFNSETRRIAEMFLAAVAVVVGERLPGEARKMISTAQNPYVMAFRAMQFESPFK